MSRRAVWPLLLLALLPCEPALAAGEQKAFMVGVVGAGALALFAFLAGLATHTIVLGYAPRRARSLVLAADGRHRWKTLVLGLVNTFALAVVFHWSERRAPPLAMLTLATWCVSILVGSHGIARGLGRKALGIVPEELLTPAGELRALALGWFVFTFASVVPLLGYALCCYWSIRSTGVVAYTLLAPDEPDLEPSLVPTDPVAPQA